jgi:hypothetical protein
MGVVDERGRERRAERRRTIQYMSRGDGARRRVREGGNGLQLPAFPTKDEGGRVRPFYRGGGVYVPGKERVRVRVHRAGSARMYVGEKGDSWQQI